MARLPIPGQDNNVWGGILNDFLAVEHAADGALKRAGQADGLATLDSGAKIPVTQLGGSGASGTTFLRGDRTWAAATDSAAVHKGDLVYNVRDYGAAGNGTTDDFTAIQDTINAAQTAGGGTIFFPKGTYIVSSHPQITGSGIVVRGSGTGSVIRLATAAMNASGTTLGLWVNGATNVTIENLAFDGNFDAIAKNGSFHSASSLWSPIISAYGASSVKNYVMAGSGIDAITYLQYRAPIRITNANNVVVQNCLVENSVSAGILVDATSVNGCTNILITNCRIRLCWDNGIYFHQGVQYASAVNNIISDITYNGVSAVYSDRILISHNNIRLCGPSDSDSGGIQINGSSNCTVTGNLIDQCQFYGINCLASQETNITNGLGGRQVWAQNTHVEGNHITLCQASDSPTHTAPGINVFGAHNTTIMSNSVDKCDIGVSLGSQAFNTNIIGNRLIRSLAQGVLVGNAADVVNTTAKGNYIAWNASTGIYAYAPVRIDGNTILGNVGMGIELATKPSGLSQKIDYVLGNTITDNTDSGVHANGGTNSLAVIKENIFGNSQQALFYDGVSNGTTTFTSASAAFTAADVGAVIIIVDQGTNGVTTTTTVASYVNATTITLSAPPAGSQTGLAFAIGRGPQYFTDGSTNADANTVLTSASAGFSANDVGKLVTLYTLDPLPHVIASAAVATYTSSTQVVLNTAIGQMQSVAFLINRSKDQQIRAINADSQVMDLRNTVIGIPELLIGGATTNLVQHYNPGFPARGAVANWNFDEGSGSSIADAVGTNTGTWNGTLGSQWATGRINRSGNFNGTDNYVSFGTDAGLAVTTAITISLWMYPSGTQAAYASPIAKSGSYWLEGDGGGTNQYQFFLHTSSDQSAGLFQITANAWNHVVLAWDGTTATTYLNGRVVQSQALTGTISSNANVLLAGNRDGFSRFYSGRLDELGLWGRALLPGEVQTLYNAGSGVQYGGSTASHMS